MRDIDRELPRVEARDGDAVDVILRDLEWMAGLWIACYLIHWALG